MLEKFLADLAVPGCSVQLGTTSKILFWDESPKPDELKKFLMLNGGKDLFFLGGVNASTGNWKEATRAKDSDVSHKNYFYIDFDLRKNHPEYTDEQIKGQIATWVTDTLADLGDPYDRWRYVVFTGNGLHVYYFGFKPVPVQAEPWKRGLMEFVEHVSKAFGEEVDPTCVNISRIARLPGSLNHKSLPAKRVEILDFRDKRVDLEGMVTRGRELAEKKKAAVAAEPPRPVSDDTYQEIQRLPVGELMCRLMGWTLDKNGKNFWETGDPKPKAPFVSDKGNFIVHGGTKYLPPSKVGYKPFELVKNLKKYDNSQVFDWFKMTYPHIRAKSFKEHAGFQETPADYGIGTAFEELRHLELRCLSIGEFWDDWRLLVRGKVTRVGAMPGTGKSKLGYFLTHQLLLKEYRGLFFSSEVQTAEVIAHMLQIRMERPYLDILEHRVDVPKELEADYKNLKVFDVRHTGNNLGRIEQIVKREKDRAEASGERPPDFIVLDFSQQFTPKGGGSGEIFSWAMRYGNECQELSQKYDVAVIDVCQLSLKGNKDEEEKYGHVPYEGGNKLHQTADISSLISRDRSLSGQNEQVMWSVRKSKAMGRRFDLEMSYSWTTGRFELESAQDSRDSLPISYRGIRQMRAKAVPPKAIQDMGREEIQGVFG